MTQVYGNTITKPQVNVNYTTIWNQLNAQLHFLQCDSRPQCFGSVFLQRCHRQEGSSHTLHSLYPKQWIDFPPKGLILGTYKTNLHFVCGLSSSKAVFSCTGRQDPGDARCLFMWAKYLPLNEYLHRRNKPQKATPLRKTYINDTFQLCKKRKKKETAPLPDINSVVLSGMFSVTLLTVYLLRLPVGGHIHTHTHILIRLRAYTQEQRHEHSAKTILLKQNFVSKHGVVYENYSSLCADNWVRLAPQRQLRCTVSFSN